MKLLRYCTYCGASSRSARWTQRRCRSDICRGCLRRQRWCRGTRGLSLEQCGSSANESDSNVLRDGASRESPRPHESDRLDDDGVDFVGIKPKKINTALPSESKHSVRIGVFFLLSLLSFSLGLSRCLDLWSESNVSGGIGDSGT